MSSCLRNDEPKRGLTAIRSCAASGVILLKVSLYGSVSQSCIIRLLSCLDLFVRTCINKSHAILLHMDSFTIIFKKRCRAEMHQHSVRMGKIGKVWERFRATDPVVIRLSRGVDMGFLIADGIVVDACIFATQKT